MNLTNSNPSWLCLPLREWRTGCSRVKTVSQKMFAGSCETGVNGTNTSLEGTVRVLFSFFYNFLLNKMVFWGEVNRTVERKEKIEELLRLSSTSSAIYVTSLQQLHQHYTTPTSPVSRHYITKTVEPNISQRLNSQCLESKSKVWKRVFFILCLKP